MIILTGKFFFNVVLSLVLFFDGMISLPFYGQLMYHKMNI